VNKRWGQQCLSFLIEACEKSHCVLNRKSPQFLFDDFRPAVHGMKKYCSGPLSYAHNEALGDPILPMGANTAKAQLLLLFVTSFLEGLSGIYSVVRPDGFNIDIVLLRP